MASRLVLLSELCARRTERDLANLRKTKLQDMIMHELILVETDMDNLIALARFLRDRRKRTPTPAVSKSASGHRRA
jgi:hypothetical protein